jgi:hypothetical protein
MPRRFPYQVWFARSCAAVDMLGLQSAPSCAVCVPLRPSPNLLNLFTCAVVPPSAKEGVA